MTAATGGIAVALLFLLPGLALGPALVPGSSTPLGRLGRAVGLSLIVGMILSMALAAVGLLTGPVFALSLVATCAAGLAVPRRRIRSRLRIPGRRERRWWAGAIAGSVIALALVVLPSRALVGPEPLPVTSTSWYYANLAQVIATSNRIPTALAEWGSFHSFQTDYLPVSTHTAGFLLLSPGDLLADTEIYRVAILLAGLVLSIVLLRRWVSSWAALLGTILLFSTIHLQQKFSGYRPETVAFDLLLFTIWLIDRAIVEHRRRLLGLAIVTSALVLLAHAEVFLVLVSAIAGLGLARTVVADGTRRPRVGLRLLPGSSGLRSLAFSAGVVVGGVGLGGVALFAATGNPGAFGYLPSSQPSSAAMVHPEPPEIPVGWTFSNDPTWDFYVAAVAPNYVGVPPPSSFRDSRLLPRTILRVWAVIDGRTGPGLVALIALGLAPILAWPWLDARRRRAIVLWLTFGAALVLGSYVLFAISDTYVPQRTGGVRLMPYLVFIPVLEATFLLWGVGRFLRIACVGARLGSRLSAPSRLGAVGVATLLAIVAVGAVGLVSTSSPGRREPALDPTGYRALEWIRDHLPADARILANAYTDGSIAAVSGRVGIVDGRAVYLEDPGFLADSIALCLGARVVFADPSSPGAGSFLTREQVGYLLVSTAGPLGRDVGGYPLFQTDAGALAASPRLHLMRSFGDGRLLLYEVAGSP